MTNRKKPVFVVFLVFAFAGALASAGAPEPVDTDPATLADQFGQALKAGDEAIVRSLLDENVLIFESGAVESSLAEYAAHHLGADITFMSNMNKEILSRNVYEDGDMTVVSTRYRMHGSYNGRDFDQVSSETLVLRKSLDGWKIVHIHWS